MIEYIVFLIETGLLGGLVIFLVREYSAKDVPTYVQVLTYISWFFTFIVFIILPIDIANSYRESLQSIDVDNEADDYLYVLWRVLYWINFSLSWVILPLFQDYEDSGEFTVKRKLLSSLKKNLIIYATGLTLGLVLIFYLAFSKKLSMLAIEGILAGLGNTFGIFLVILLLGYGFVAIPKKYIKESDEEKILTQHYCLASEIDERRTEDLYELEEKCKILQCLNHKYQNSEFTQYLNIIELQVPKQLRPNYDNSTNASISSSVMLEGYEPLTMNKVAELNRDVKRLLSDLHRIDVRLGVISEEIFRLEKIRIGGDDYIRNLERPVSFFGRLNQQCSNLWDFKIRRPFNKYIGYFFALLSFILLSCELSIFTGIPINLIHVLVTLNLGYYASQFVLIPFVFYIAFCTYYGLFGMKIAGMYSFNKHHQTDAPSLLFGSINFGRVSFPLCYNFIGLTQIKMLTSFTEIVGDMNVIPLFGTTFSFVLPLMLILMCFFNLFNLQGKILNAIGLTSYAEKDHKDVLAAEEGKKVIQKEKKERDQRSKVKVSDDQQTPTVQELVPRNVWGNPQNKEQNQYMKSFDGILNI